MQTLDERARALRGFSRFCARRIGAVGDPSTGARFSLTESRLLWELAQPAAGAAGAETAVTATRLARQLQLDPGYLSRVLAGLRERGLVKAQRGGDRRSNALALTAAGRRALTPLDRRAQQHARELLAALPEPQQHQLVGAAAQIETLLGARAPAAAALRPLRSGDLGWVVSRHGALYADDHGWDLRFEAMVARICADFVDRLEPGREAAWLAESDAQPLGCVFLVQARATDTGAVQPGVAQLRLLLVEPQARGHGLGKRLTAECERFARAAGYSQIRLWTHSLLLAARGIYRAAGYQLVASAAHRSFGQDLVGETWQKDLCGPGAGGAAR